jgi:hypothetical protein
MNNPYDRVNLGLRERPVSSDFNRLQSQADRALRDTLGALFSSRNGPGDGFIGSGFQVVPTSPVAMSVQVSAGMGMLYVPLDVPTDIGSTDLEAVDDRSAFKPVYLAAPAIFTVPTAPGLGLSRIDIIEVRHDRRLDDPVTRRQLDTVTETFLDHQFYKTLTWALDGRTGTVTSPTSSTAAIGYKTGAAAATGAEVEPSVTSGYVQIARINVGPSVTTIPAGSIADKRKLLGSGGSVAASLRYRVQWNSGDPIVTIESHIAPPGVSMGVGADDAIRGSALIGVVGGEIAYGTVNVTLENPSALSESLDHVAPRFSKSPLAGGFLAAITSGEAATFAAYEPAITVGVGQKRGSVKVNGIYLDNAGGAPSITNAALEDLTFTVSFLLSY